MAAALGIPALSQIVARLLAFLLALLPWVSAQAERTGAEAEVKAALVYNLLLFVQWPDDRLPGDGSLRLCVLGSGAAAEALVGLSGKAIHNRPLTVKQIAGSSEEARTCQALWVEEGKSGQLGRLALAARSNGLLLLGEGGTTLAQGAMIAVANEGGRLVFSVDNGAAREARLAISSKLLRLARNVVDRAHD